MQAAAKGSQSSRPSTLAGTIPVRPNGIIECFMRLGDTRQLASDNVASSVKEETTLVCVVDPGRNGFATNLTK